MSSLKAALVVYALSNMICMGPWRYVLSYLAAWRACSCRMKTPDEAISISTPNVVNCGSHWSVGLIVNDALTIMAPLHYSPAYRQPCFALHVCSWLESVPPPSPPKFCLLYDSNLLCLIFIKFEGGREWSWCMSLLPTIPINSEITNTVRREPPHFQISSGWFVLSRKAYLT